LKFIVLLNALFLLLLLVCFSLIPKLTLKEIDTLISDIFSSELFAHFETKKGKEISDHWEKNQKEGLWKKLRGRSRDTQGGECP
jgi:hypothetical protein